MRTWEKAEMRAGEESQEEGGEGGVAGITEDASFTCCEKYQSICPPPGSMSTFCLQKS